MNNIISHSLNFQENLICVINLLPNSCIIRIIVNLVISKLKRHVSPQENLLNWLSRLWNLNRCKKSITLSIEEDQYIVNLSINSREFTQLAQYVAEPQP